MALAGLNGFDDDEDQTLRPVGAKLTNGLNQSAQAIGKGPRSPDLSGPGAMTTTLKAGDLSSFGFDSGDAITNRQTTTPQTAVPMKPPGPDKMPAGGPADFTTPQPSTPAATPPAPTSPPTNKYGSTVARMREASDPTEQALLQDQLARQVYSDLQAAGHNVKWSGDQLVVDGRPYELAGAEQPAVPGPGGVPVATTGGNMVSEVAPYTPPQTAWGDVLSGAMTEPAPSYGVGSAPGLPDAWAPSAPTYTPGEISTSDIPQVSMDDLLAKLQNPNLDALIGNILQNPTALSDQVVATQKGKSADDLAEAQRAQDEALAAYAQQMGIKDSNWEASERLAGRRDFAGKLADSNRNIELEAARTAMADKLNAANLGLQASNTRQSAVFGSVDAALKKSAALGDRLALRENVNQKAAELGQSADKIMTDYLVAKMDDLTRRYGIDIGAQVDMNKLNEQSREFKEDLAFKLESLEQQDRQFGANYGLDVAKFKADQDNWGMLQYLMPGFGS